MRDFAIATFAPLGFQHREQYPMVASLLLALLPGGVRNSVTHLAG
jgi:hypothetical protein